MNLNREPAVAGQFYSDNPQELQRNVDECIQAATSVMPEGLTEVRPKALIVPHAGYIYSGVVAASAYACLKAYKYAIERVVLIGPSHHISFKGLATCHHLSFETPLGLVKLDRSGIHKIEALPFVQAIDQAHHFEHSLEVQLPFLQTAIHDFSLIPLVVGDADKYQVAQVIELLWGGPETLFVISSDLSHFLDYDLALTKDTHTAQCIESLNADAIEFDDACGRNPVKGLLHSALKHDLQPTRLALCNSGDTAGDKSRVVGYGAWYFA